MKSLQAHDMHVVSRWLLTHKQFAVPMAVHGINESTGSHVRYNHCVDVKILILFI